MTDYHRRKIERPNIDESPSPAQVAAGEAMAAAIEHGSGLKVEIYGQTIEGIQDVGDVQLGEPAPTTETQLLSCIGSRVNISWELTAAAGDPWEAHPRDITGTCSAAGRVDGGWLVVTVDGVTYYIPEDREVHVIVLLSDMTIRANDTNSPPKQAPGTAFRPPQMDFSDVEGYAPVGYVPIARIPETAPLPDLTPKYPDEDTSAANVLSDTAAPVVPNVEPQHGPIAPANVEALGVLGGWYLEVLSTEDPHDLRAPYDRVPPADEPMFMYIAGTAGTGKTYIARLRSTNYDDAMLCATTGIAAVNLGGVTINSKLRYFDTASMRTEFEYGRLGVALRQMAGSGFTRLVIDEVSMMEGQQLDILMLALDEVNEWRVSKHEKPIGVTLTGDFAQLPPVDDKDKKAEFVFERPSWARFEEHTLMLSEPRRQADASFVRALQQVRRGDQGAVDYFRQFIQKSEIKNFDGSTILAKNVEVDRLNALRMLELNGPEWTSKAVRTGRPAPDWKNIPDAITLKPEALVMILANHYDRTDPMDPILVYANGDLGHFIRTAAHDEVDPMAGAYVRLHRTGQEVYVGRVSREYTTATGNKGTKAARENIEGTISYLPLRVAYGTTVHKSQGLSLDNVQLMINSQFWMQSGMLYVALSRARTPQGLKIVGTPDQFRARIRSNPKIKRWL